MSHYMTVLMTRVARAPYTDGESERNEVDAERPCRSEMPASQIMKGPSAGLL